MPPKHGNWNIQPQLAEDKLREQQHANRARAMTRITALARALYDVFADSDLSEDERNAAVEMFNVMRRHLGGN